MKTIAKTHRKLKNRNFTSDIKYKKQIKLPTWNAKQKPTASAKYTVLSSTTNSHTLSTHPCNVIN